VQRHLRDDGEDQPRHHRAQVAGRRQHQKPPEQPRASTMPAPNISPPMMAPDHDPVTAIIRASSGGTGQQTRALHPDHRGREGQQPDRHLRTQTAARELDRRRAQAERRPLRRDAEDEMPRSEPEIAAPLAAALAARGYETLTPVQQAMLAPEAGPRRAGQRPDRIGQDRGLRHCHRARPSAGADRLLFADQPVALVIAPTRELALQVARNWTWLYADRRAHRLLRGRHGLPHRAPGAGARRAYRGRHPGRLRDHIERGSLDLSGLRAAVLDEADEMLDLGFREDLEFILAERARKAAP
jgi:hypothetical protein